MPFVLGFHGPRYVKETADDDTVCIEYRNCVLAPSNGGVEIWRLRRTPVKIIPNRFGHNNFAETTEIYFYEQIRGSIEDAKYFIDRYAE